MASYNPPLTYLVQTHFQIYEDGVSLNGSPPLAGVDAAAQVTVGQNFRCRLQIACEEDFIASFRYLLEYRVNGGAWRAADASESVRIVSSAFFTDGEQTTSRIGYAGGVYVAGEGIETTRNSAIITLQLEKYTEIEWNLSTSGLVIGDVVEMRAVAMNTTWSGGQNYTAYPITVNNTAIVIISQTPGEVEAKMMYEIYTEVGVGVEAAGNFSKWVPASLRVNAVARLPSMSPAKLTFGGFRGIDAPTGVVMGQLAPAGITLQVETTPDQLGKWLASLFGNPSTTGTAPTYTHNFLAGNAPRTLTIWQKEHYASDEASPVFGGYGGCIFSEWTLEADVRAGGILQSSFAGLAATYLLHNSASTTGMNSAYGNARPFTIEGATLTIRDSSGATPAWAGEVQSIRLRLARQNVYPLFGFRNKAIAKGYAYRQAVHLVELSIEVYRVGLRPLKLVLGQGEGASYPVAPAANVQIYDPATGGALRLEFTSSENSNWKLTIETPRFAWIELSATSGGEDPMMDTYVLMPLVEGTATLSALQLVNANSAEPGADGTPITVASGPYTPF